MLTAWPTADAEVWAAALVATATDVETVDVAIALPIVTVAVTGTT